jgi:hypothetical protein
MASTWRSSGSPGRRWRTSGREPVVDDLTLVYN